MTIGEIITITVLLAAQAALLIGGILYANKENHPEFSDENRHKPRD